MTTSSDNFESFSIKPEEFHPLVGILAPVPSNEEIVEIISPQPLPTKKQMELGLFDQGMVSAWFTFIHAFPGNGNKKLDLTQLRLSLAQTIGILPVVSGSIINKNGSEFDPKLPNIEVAVALNNIGTWFTFNKASDDMNFKELQKDDFNLERHNRELLFYKAQQAIIDNQSPLPILAIKVTEFTDNNIIITIMISHIISDGKSIHLFMKLWSQLYRNIQPDPIRDKRLSFSQSLELSIRSRQFLSNWQNPVPYQLPEVTFKTARFSIEIDKIKQLKHEINEKLHPRWVSTDDLLSAIIYQAIKRARNVPKSTLTSLIRAVDIRSELGPKFKQSFGNNFIYYHHPCESHESLEATPILELSSNFRTLLNEHRNLEFIMDVLSALQHLPIKGNSLRVFPNTLLTSSYAQNLPESIIFHSPCSIFQNLYCIPGLMLLYPPTSTHYFVTGGIITDDINNLVNDTCLLKLGFQIEVTPYNTSIV